MEGQIEKKLMLNRVLFFSVVFITWLVLMVQSSSAAGNIEAGREVFLVCVACHSLEPNQHMTGPSLAGIFGRTSGTIEGFTRYSPAIKLADIIWNLETLDSWLENPQKLIPNNRMPFNGIRDKQARTDLIAFLKDSTEADRSASKNSEARKKTRTRPRLDLKNIVPQRQVKTIRHQGDTYYVTTMAGSSFPFWEFNLRLKTDSSHKGPNVGHPALIPASMRGDRAFVIFSNPSEINAFIEVSEGGQPKPAAPDEGKKKISNTKPNLKNIGSNRQIKSIRYCGDTYHVTTVSGFTVPFWESNLRFKTDSSRKGPNEGVPVIVPSGMRGDRASIIFSNLSEVKVFIKPKC